MKKRLICLLLVLCLLVTSALPALATSANIKLVDSSGNPTTGTIRVTLYDSANDKALSGGKLTLYRVAEVKRQTGNLSYEYCGDFYGCGIALGLNAYDRHGERITPISGGQTVDFSAYGFTLTVPDDFSLNDYTTNNAAEGGNALFAGCVYGSLGELYLFCYANESGDSLRQHREQDVVTYYMNAGATDVRLRTLGGRRFICYRATVDREDGEETWDTYETWDGDIQLTFETRMSPGDVLPILATIAFTPIAQEN